jgi:hypothetical protein
MTIEIENQYIFAIYSLALAGLLFDRYVLMKHRLVEQMLEETKEKQRCIVCGRPMLVIPDEEQSDDKNH